MRVTAIALSLLVGVSAADAAVIETRIGTPTGALLIQDNANIIATPPEETVRPLAGAVGTVVAAPSMIVSFEGPVGGSSNLAATVSVDNSLGSLPIAVTFAYDLFVTGAVGPDTAAGGFIAIADILPPGRPAIELDVNVSPGAPSGTRTRSGIFDFVVGAGAVEQVGVALRVDTAFTLPASSGSATTAATLRLTDVAVIPVPAAGLLLATALAGLAVAARRKRLPL